MRFPFREKQAKDCMSGAFSFLVLLAIFLSSSQPAQAIPAFARKYGLPCSACHIGWPELNNFGQVFRDNGYQMMNDMDSPITRDASYFPMTIRITPQWHRESANNQAPALRCFGLGQNSASNSCSIVHGQASDKRAA